MGERSELRVGCSPSIIDMCGMSKVCVRECGFMGRKALREQDGQRRSRELPDIKNSLFYIVPTFMASSVVPAVLHP